MKRIIIGLISAPLLAGIFCAPVFAQKTKAQLTTEIGTTYPDNTVGAITPAGVRTYETDVLNSIMPTAPVVAGNSVCWDGTTGLLKDCGSSPVTTPLTVGVTPINGGATTRVLFDNGGVIGEYSISGTGSVCMTVSCVMTTPNLGTPSAGVLTNATGLPISSGVSGLGTGIATALGINTGSAGAPVLFNGALGTPSSGVLTNATGLPLGSGVTGNLPVGNLNSGSSASSSTFWRGDGTWATPAGGGNVSTSGAPTNHQIAGWINSTQVQGIGPGTTGQALISQGAGADPSYVGGARVLLAILTASASATLSDTTHITSTYPEYILVFENILPATNNVNCEIQVHTGGAFPSSSYGTNSLRFTGGVSAVSNPGTFIPCDANNATTANTGTGISGEITLYNASQTTSPKMWVGNFAANGSAVGAVVNGAYTGANTAIDGFQVLMSSGNIASGTIKLYGRL